MKATRFIIIFIIALLCLLGLQSVWLYNTYQLEKSKAQELIRTSFIDAAQMELNERMDRLELLYKERGIDSLSFEGFNFTIDSAYLSSARIVPIDFIAMNFLLHHEAEYPFQLPLLDTVYSSLLKERGLRVSYRLDYVDSINHSIETINPQILDGYETDAIPIVNGNNVQAVVELSVPAVFQKMLGILIVSVVILCFIVGCIVYEIQAFITQQQLSRLRDNFMYALTHDMKTPLGTIHTVLDQSAKGVLDSNPKMKSKFNEIGMEQVLNLQALVNQILTIAQMEQKKLSVHKQQIELPAMIDGLVNKFSVSAGKDIHFDVQLDLQESEIWADPLYLTNAISNLIDNAIKYSGATVNIIIKAVVKGNQVYIHVIDNGFGISESDQKKIFDRFERGAEIKRKKASGFGIGLNYVKAVTESHGGGITLTSREGVGSEFVITLPLQ